MTSQIPFRQYLARVTGLGDTTLRAMVASLRNAGLFTSTGARGVNAPTPTEHDATRLLIATAVCFTPAPTKAAEFASAFECAVLDQVVTKEAAFDAKSLPDTGVDFTVHQRATVAVRASTTFATFIAEAVDAILAPETGRFDPRLFVSAVEFDLARGRVFVTSSFDESDETQLVFETRQRSRATLPAQTNHISRTSRVPLVHFAEVAAMVRAQSPDP